MFLPFLSPGNVAIVLMSTVKYVMLMGVSNVKIIIICLGIYLPIGLMVHVCPTVLQDFIKITQLHPYLANNVQHQTVIPVTQLNA